MPISILMPALSPTMTEGNLAKWLKSEGDAVKSGDVIAEIETDKATMEVEAVDEGTLGKILVPGGTEGVKVSEPIAVLLIHGEDSSSLKGFNPRTGVVERQICPVCKKPHADVAMCDKDAAYQIGCDICGTFRMSQKVFENVAPENAINYKLFGWLKEQTEAGLIQEINEDTLKRLVDYRVPPFSERVDRLLLRAFRITGAWGGVFNYADYNYVASVYGRNMDDLSLIVRLLRDQNLVDDVTEETFRITPKGVMRAEELLSIKAESHQAFVAMWFSEEMREIYTKGFEPAIREAGYLPLRIDNVEHSNDINDEMIVQIKRSKFIVADFTGHRGGVYFEAGFAMGIGLPVLLTCRADQVDLLHFDLRQFNYIDWPGVFQLKQRLTRRIQALIGEGSILSA